MDETDDPYECAECGADDHPSSECPNKPSPATCPESSDGWHRIGVMGEAEHYGEETYVDVICELCERPGSVRIDQNVRWSDA